MSVRFLKIAFTFICVAGLGACTPRIDQRGKVLEKEQLDQIRPGISTKEDVLRHLGSPSSIPAFNDKVWLYMHRKTSTVSFFDPKILDTGVIKIQFSPANTVEEIHELDGKGHDIAPVRRVTTSATGDQSWTQQIFGNFGRQRNKKD
tara:strand:+ start:6602 stop:7042 length:441 start_codon:yes stop_codon:yes gene_type:complete